MAKPTLDVETKRKEDEAFEIIELAIDDINLLVRAFDVISEVCEGKEEPRIHLDQAPAAKLH